MAKASKEQMNMNQIEYICFLDFIDIVLVVIMLDLELFSCKHTGSSVIGGLLKDVGPFLKAKLEDPCGARASSQATRQMLKSAQKPKKP